MQLTLGLRAFRQYAGNWERQFAGAGELGCSYLQVDGIAPEHKSLVRRLRQETGIGIWSITALSTAMLGPDLAKARQEQENVPQAIRQAQRWRRSAASQRPAGNLPTRLMQSG